MANSRVKRAIIADSLQVQTIGSACSLLGFDIITGTEQVLATWPTRANIDPHTLLSNKYTLARALGFTLIAEPPRAVATNDNLAAIIQIIVWLLIAAFVGLKGQIK